LVIVVVVVAKHFDFIKSPTCNSLSMIAIYAGRHELINGGLIEALLRAIGIQSVHLG
jgi:threonine synthase